MLTKRHQKLYCSNRCQRASERTANVARWLESGVGSPGTQRGHYIRLYLLEDQQRNCAICGLATMWHGVELTLVLDHIDGDSQNNARENLRMICPNCDSQLSTYKSRNRGRGRAWRRQRYAAGKSY